MLIPDIFSKYPQIKPVKGVLHVGAHHGEERDLYLSVGMTDDQILWIDGNSDYESLFKGKRFLAALITDKDDEKTDFRITNNGQSSSILALKTHLQEHPQVQEISKRSLSTVTLDTLLEKNGYSHDSFDFINLDIQGAELLALKGASKILPHVKAIYTEVNIRELYEGCAFMKDIDDFLGKSGFIRVETRMTQHGWGDALYIKA